MTPEQRKRFDSLLDEVLASLPDVITERFGEMPLVVEDAPSLKLLASMGLAPRTLLCGLHTGVPITERTVELSGAPTDEIRIFREGVMASAGATPDLLSVDRLREEIRITLLHELGHHFGLDEDDLASLGYE